MLLILLNLVLSTVPLTPSIDSFCAQILSTIPAACYDIFICTQSSLALTGKGRNLQIPFKINTFVAWNALAGFCV